MKKFAILVATVCMVGYLTSESQAQHGHGHRGGGNRSAFSISIGSGGFYGNPGVGFSYNNFGRGYGVPFYGGIHHHHGHYGIPVAPVRYYNNFGPRYYGGYGGYGGFRPGCGGGGVYIGW